MDRKAVKIPVRLRRSRLSELVYLRWLCRDVVACASWHRLLGVHARRPACSRAVSKWLLLLGCGLVAGCSSESGGTSRSVGIRFVHAATAVPAMDIVADGKLEEQELRYAQDTDYRYYSSPPDEIKIYDTGLSDPILEFEGDFRKGDDYTVVIVSTPTASGFKYTPYIFPDDLEPSDDEGETRLRVINASPAAGEVDVYAVKQRDSLAGRKPTAASLEVGEASDYVELIQGEFDLRLTEKGSKDVVAEETRVNLRSAAVNTAVILDNRQTDTVAEIVVLRDES